MKAKYAGIIVLSLAFALAGCGSGKTAGQGSAGSGGASSAAASADDSRTEPSGALSAGAETGTSSPEEVLDGGSGEGFAEQPLVETGEYWEGSLGPGVYRVGTDIPVGVINITAKAGSGHVTSSDGTLNLDMTAPDEEDEDGGSGETPDPEDTGDDGHVKPGDELVRQILAAENSAFPDLDSVDTLTDEEMNELLAGMQVQEETDRFQSVGFMEDVIITVSGAVTLNVESVNCDVAGMQKRRKIGDPVSLSEGSYTAGEDFEPGTYVITAADGFGSVSLGDGSMFAYMGSPEEPGINSGRYRNCVCAEGAVLRVEGLEVELQQVSG